MLIRKVLFLVGVALLCALGVRGWLEVGPGATSPPVIVDAGGPPSATYPYLLEDFPLNLAGFRLLNSHPSPALDTLFSTCWYLGNGIVLIPLLMIVWSRRPGKVPYLLLAVALETLAVTVLKSLWSQPRPGLLLEGVRMLHPLYAHSFPSGDAALACALAGSLAPGESVGWKAALLGYAVLIALERVYVGVHFPLDVLAAALVGLFSAWLAYRLWDGRPRRGLRRSGRGGEPAGPLSCL